MSPTILFIEGSIIRKARKAYICSGDGASKAYRHYAPRHSDINPGDRHVEYVGETSIYESGTRHCWACALTFLQVEATR